MYRIVRFYFSYPPRTRATGLTLEEVQAHCRDPESSSRTCTTEEGRGETWRNGSWFDGYEECESNED